MSPKTLTPYQIQTTMTMDRAIHARLRIMAYTRKVTLYKMLDDCIRLGIAVFEELSTMETLGLSDKELADTVRKIARKDALKEMIARRKIDIKSILLETDVDTINKPKK